MPIVDDLRKYKPDQIDQYIRQFKEMADNKTNRNYNRFVARGAFLSALRDSLDDRLRAGWTYLAANPDSLDAADLWMKLLDRYEQICDLLEQTKDQVTTESAARSIFKGVEVDEHGGIRVGVADRPHQPEEAGGVS